MSYTSDQQLAALGLKPLAHIPNRAGYRVVLRTRDGVDVTATVRKHDVTQTHFCDYPPSYCWGDFIGWSEAADVDNALIRHKAGPGIIDAHLQGSRRARVKI